jgi:hypothetical protein
VFYRRADLAEFFESLRTEAPTGVASAARKPRPKRKTNNAETANHDQQ